MAYKQTYFVKVRKDGVTILYARYYNARLLVERAKKSKLHLPIKESGLKKAYREITARPRRSDAIALIAKDNVCVAVAVVTEQEFNQSSVLLVNVYCHAKYRNQGFGSLALSTLRFHDRTSKFKPYGIIDPEGIAFYIKHGLLTKITAKRHLG